MSLTNIQLDKAYDVFDKGNEAFGDDSFINSDVRNDITDSAIKYGSNFFIDSAVLVGLETSLVKDFADIERDCVSNDDILDEIRIRREHSPYIMPKELVGIPFWENLVNVITQRLILNDIMSDYENGEWPPLDENDSKCDDEVKEEVSTDFKNALNWTAPRRRDPLVLDLDGDGIETTAADGSVNFDHDGDGVKNGTGWISGDDGMLVLDRNGNGTIDNGGELFGDNTIKADGSKALNGFDALAELDTNNDGKVDAADTQFSELRIWQDFNQDGISQSNELSTLADLGIQSIGTGYTSSTQDVGHNNLSIAQGSFIKTDGTAGDAGTTTQSSGAAESLNLVENNFYREFTDHIALPDSLQDHPDMQGSGAVRDLLQAAALSPDLAALLTAYAGAATKAAQQAQLDGLLIAWANTAQFDMLSERLQNWNTNNANSGLSYQGDYAGGTVTSVNDKLQILEVFNNQAFSDVQNIINSDGSSRLSNPQQNFIDAAYLSLRESVYNALLSQTRLKSYLQAVDIKVTDEGELGLGFTNVETVIVNGLAENPEATVENLLELNQITGDQFVQKDWNVYYFLSEQISTDNSLAVKIIPLLAAQGIKLLSATETNYSAENATIFIAGNNTANHLTGGNNSDVIYGRDGDDNLQGGQGDDLLLGGKGSDTLQGGSGNDELVGGEGNDLLNGGYGNDVYKYNLGDGSDLIQDTAGTDTLSFGFGLSLSDIKATRVGSDLVLSITNPTDSAQINQITLQNMYANSTSARIEHFSFTDGTVLNIQQIFALVTGVVAFSDGAENIYGTEFDDQISAQEGNDIVRAGSGDDYVQGDGGNDSIYGGDGNDTLDGGAGDDVIRGGDGNDYLRGGIGNDVLYGGEGDDTYLYAAGDGNTTIYNDTDAQSHDVLRFDASINPQDVKLSTSGSNLLITLQQTNEVITIIDAFSVSTIDGFITRWNQSRELSEIVFEDGTRWDTYTIRAKALTGTENNDDITGFMSDDLITGLGGDDNLKGGNGDDRLLGGAGNDDLDGDKGNDVLDGGAGVDVLSGGEGDDILRGGAGDGDQLWGNQGDDTYLYGLGDGDINIYNNVGATINDKDVLKFLEGISPNDVIATRFGSSTDLFLVLKGSREMITVLHYFSSYRSNFIPLSTIEFADGTVWDESIIKKLVLLPSELNDQLYGTSDNDVMNGLSGDDLLHAHDGNDTLFGGDGNDTLYGETGDDYLYGQNGNDELVGAEGNDYYVTGSGNDSIVILDNHGHDVIDTSGGGINNILFYGSLILDRLSFTQDGNDLLILIDEGSLQSIRVTNHFLGGENAIDGIKAANGIWLNTDKINLMVLASNSGVDTVVQGTAIGEQLLGTNGTDLIQGLAGDDQLYGFAGNDRLEGGAGNDRLQGGNGSNSGSGDDILIGGAGNDILVGEDGNDLLDGGDGNDHYYYYANSGVDTITDAGNGQDILFFIDVSADRLSYLRDGDDLLVRVDGDATQQVIVKKHFLGGDHSIYVQPNGGYTLTPSQINALAEEVVEQGEGEADSTDTSNDSAGSDTDTSASGSGSTTSSGASVLDLTGNDVVTGAINNDVLVSGDGNDTINGGAGDDLLIGGDGDDVYIFDSNSGKDIIVDVNGQNIIRFTGSIGFNDVASGLMKSGNDLILKVSNTNNQVTIKNFFTLANTFEKIEFVVGGQLTAAQLYGAFGLTAPSMLADSSQVLFGSSQADELVGGDTSDTIIAGKGDDTLSGGNGDDLLVGGLGNDIYIIGSNSGHDTIIDTQGNNTIRFVDGISFNDVASDLMRTGDDLVLNIAGNTNNVRINNFFSVADTIDQIEFEAGGQISAAQLYGVFGLSAPTTTQVTSDILSDNQIVGTEADDRLVSGAGNDTLTGAAGNDTYVFKSGFGQDIILNNDAASSADIAQFSDVNYQELWLSRSGDDLQINITGSDDQVKVDDWYAGEQYQLDQIRVGNAVLLNNQVDQLVSAMASFDVPNGVGSVIAQQVKDDLQVVLTQTWQTS
ncbi:MAG: hypothetical protein OFPII_01710 [Osedax symbiont Rs1]|nr:MAG: hypothetical protein OFPII_01710 [Osedax symbiont Rs1]